MHREQLRPDQEPARGKPCVSTSFSSLKLINKRKSSLKLINKKKDGVNTIDLTERQLQLFRRLKLHN